MAKPHRIRGEEARNEPKRGQGQLGPEGTGRESTPAGQLHDEPAFAEAQCGSGQESGNQMEVRSTTSMRRREII